MKSSLRLKSIFANGISGNFVPDYGFLPFSSGFLGEFMFPYSNQPHTEYLSTNLKTPLLRHEDSQMGAV